MVLYKVLYLVCRILDISLSRLFQHRLQRALQCNDTCCRVFFIGYSRLGFCINRDDDRGMVMLSSVLLRPVLDYFNSGEQLY